jgi:hypothetical protein
MKASLVFALALASLLVPSIALAEDAPAPAPGPTLIPEPPNNLAGEDAPQKPRRPGHLHLGLGLFGMLPPHTRGGLMPAPGFEAALRYDTEGHFGVQLQLRFATGRPQETRMGIFAAGLGGRYYLSRADRADVSPYLGAGFAWSMLGTSNDEVFGGHNSGFGAYGEIGLEVLRRHASHLSLGVRLDLPFYMLHDGGAPWASGVMFPEEYKGSMYYAPVSVGATFAF